jgi:hypothetical protein
LETEAFELEVAAFDAPRTANGADVAFAFASEKEDGDPDSGRFFAGPSFKAAAATSASAAAAMLDVFLGLLAGATSDLVGSMASSLSLAHKFPILLHGTATR